MPSPFTQTEILKFFMLVAVVVAVVFGLSQVKDWYTASQTLKAVGHDAIATNGILNDDAKNDTSRGDQATAIQQGVTDYNSSYEGAMRNEPEVAARAERPVPASVRESFHKRRLARERFGCVAEQCGQGPAATDAQQR